MKLLIKKIISIIIVLTIILNCGQISFAATTAGQEMRTQVLYLAGIIENDNHMNEFIMRIIISHET